MLQFNNNHIFTGYLKQFLSSFNLPTCKIYTAEFEKYFTEHGVEHPEVVESNSPIVISGYSSRIRSANNIIYLKDNRPQQYFWDTTNWNTTEDINKNVIKKYWKSNKTIQYTGNKVLGFTKTLKNPTSLYNYQTHEYLGDYLRFLRDYDGINLMSMYNCFSNRLCNNIKFSLNWPVQYEEEHFATGEKEQKEKEVSLTVNAYDTGYKIYMLPVKLFENYTIAIDCYQGVELFCGLYNKKLDTSAKARNLIKKTYVKIPKALFNQPTLYDKLSVRFWNWQAENTGNEASLLSDNSQFTRAELIGLEHELKLFIKLPATNNSSITVLAGDYRNHNDSLYTINADNTWQYEANSTVQNFETKKTYKNSKLPELNSRGFTPISKLQLLALNTGISYPFSDRLLEYLVTNVIMPTDSTPDNIIRLQKVMEDCGYTFQVEGAWEPKMQMILYDYLMNSGKMVIATEKDKTGNIRYTEVNRIKHPIYKTKKDAAGKTVYDKTGNPIYIVEDQRTGNLRQRGQKGRSDFYDILGYVDKDAEKLYASWTVSNEQTVVAKNTLENIDIYSKLYNN